MLTNLVSFQTLFGSEFPHTNVTLEGLSITDTMHYRHMCLELVFLLEALRADVTLKDLHITYAVYIPQVCFEIVF